MAKGKNVLTTGDVAKICNVAPRTVSKWFDSGQLKGYRIPGSKDRRIPVSELARFMKQHNMPTNSLPGGKTRVLLVNNQEDTSFVLTDALRSADYEVQTVQTSFETGVIAQKFAPHVILISLLNGDVEAKEICRSIRTDEDLQTIKIIAMGGQLGSSEIQALIKEGFDGYIRGGADTEEIIRKIEEATAIIY